MAALEAAEAEGGDIRGRQSAALLVVAAEPSGRPWQDRVFDLRVDDHREPLIELRRLLSVARAYRHMNEGDEQVTRGNVDAAVDQYERAEALLPGESEPLFWHAVTLASVGRLDESLPLFAEAYRLRPEWRELVPRLARAQLLPDDPEMIATIVSADQ
jgi:tetratricopeptide (TPR) repeat protein